MKHYSATRGWPRGSLDVVFPSFLHLKEARHEKSHNKSILLEAVQAGACIGGCPENETRMGGGARVMGTMGTALARKHERLAGAFRGSSGNR
jgi:hypothetical protein